MKNARNNIQHLYDEEIEKESKREFDREDNNVKKNMFSNENNNNGTNENKNKNEDNKNINQKGVNSNNDNDNDFDIGDIHNLLID